VRTCVVILQAGYKDGAVTPLPSRSIRPPRMHSTDGSNTLSHRWTKCMCPSFPCRMLRVINHKT
jgi:hypothetical protein